MLLRAAQNHLISGLLRYFTDGGVIRLQYAYDSLLFLQNNLENALNIKWFLSLFEQVSGMSINFHKCDLVPINTEQGEIQEVAQTFFLKNIRKGG